MPLPLPDPYIDRDGIADGPGTQRNFDAIKAILEPSREQVRLVGAGTNPAFQNSWVNFGGGFQAAGFYKDRGRVYLQGFIDGGAASTTVFTLPAGYRPVAISAHSTLTHTGAALTFGWVSVESDGDVSAVTFGTNFLSLEGISFLAA